MIKNNLSEKKSFNIAIKINYQNRQNITFEQKLTINNSVNYAQHEFICIKI